jgi:hypothetical protein
MRKWRTNHGLDNRWCLNTTLAQLGIHSNSVSKPIYIEKQIRDQVPNDILKSKIQVVMPGDWREPTRKSSAEMIEFDSLKLSAFSARHRTSFKLLPAQYTSLIVHHVIT